jgi:hypothetical protein
VGEDDGPTAAIVSEGLGDGLALGLALGLGDTEGLDVTGAAPEFGVPDPAATESWVAIGLDGAAACAGAGAAGSVTVTPRTAVACVEPLEAVMVKAWESVAVGVPDNSPVVASNVRPAGASGESV